MAIEKDVKAIDEDAKPKKGEPKLAAEEPKEASSFVDCPECQGTGLDGEVLCANCGGSGKVLG